MLEIVRRIVLLVSLLVLPSAASTQSNTTNNYNVVKLELISGGKIIGKPEIFMETGSSAVASAMSQNGYSLKIDLKKTITSDGRLLIIEYYTPYKDRWSLAGRPTLETSLGSDSVLLLKAPDGRDLQIKIKIDKLNQKVSTQSFGKSKCSAAKTLDWKNSISKPVSYSIRKASLVQSHGPCCTVCSNFSCCSSGPVCCSDAYLCPDKRCCNYSGG